MPYELPEEVVKANNLSEDAVKAINEGFATHEQSIVSEWETKANTNAQGIIDGALKPVNELTGIQRNDGEKAADYLKRVGELYPKGKLEAENGRLKTLEAELQEKIKNGNGDAALKQQLEEAQGKIAKFDEFIAEKDKSINTLKTEHSAYKQKAAFNSEKPVFNKDANAFEIDAKWKKFMTDSLEKNEVKFDENGTPYLVDKENEFVKVKLSDAIANDESLKALMEGRRIDGSNSDPAKEVQIDGVPFKVKEGATKAEIHKAIEQQLSKDGVKVIDDAYAKKFAEYWNKITNPKK